MLSTAKQSLPWLLTTWLATATTTLYAAEDWPQFKFDGRRSGNVSERSVTAPLGLVGAVPLSDAIFTAPVVAGDRIYVVDGAGTAFCIDAKALKVIWQFKSEGGPGNCNNVSSPALVGNRLHFGTMAGSYYVLDAAEGKVIKEIRCGEPIFSAPAVSNDRAYFATLGARVYAVDRDGNIAWTWDFVKDALKFEGDRWSGEAWRQHKQGRVTWRDHFVCSRDIGLFGKTVVIPAGGRTIFLEDAGNKADVRAIGQIPNYEGGEFAAAFGQSIGEDGAVYVQWHRRDNAGRIEILRLVDGKVQTDWVRGTQTAINLPGLLSFCSISMRGNDVYRCRPEEGFGFCKHAPGQDKPQYLGGYPSIAPPILLRENAVYGGLDGSLYVVPLSGEGKPWSFATAFGRPITAPVAVCDGRIYFGCEDGYLYVLGPDGKAPLPEKDLQIDKVRSPLTGKFADPKYDWFTNYGNQACTNASAEDIETPFKITWMRRCEGTVKHLPVCGGGRMYTHTAEGIIFAVEQETGRLLWRRYFPGVYLSFTAPIYYKEKLILPQAGMKESRVRCFEAATGKLLWQTRFTGSPSWSRQGPPVIHDNLVIYASGSGKYAPQGTEKAYVMSGKPQPSPDGAEVMSWAYSHDNPYYPKDNKPLIWAWDLQTGKEVWSKDYSKYGSGGNDCGLCLMDGKVYYSTFFGYAESQRKKRGQAPGPNGITVALDPKTGNELWLTDKYYVTAGCTISGKDGRLYLGGYNQPNEGTNNRHIWCLDAKDGAIVWQSDPLKSAVNVVTVGDKFIFSNATRGDGHVIDKATGKIVSRFNNSYNCTRFTLAGTWLMGSNMDMVDLANGNKLVCTGPAIDSRECLGAVVSNGRIFYISQASGMEVSQVWGKQASTFLAPWERK
jgi:outer membrane protein assembly factor BamB